MNAAKCPCCGSEPEIHGRLAGWVVFHKCSEFYIELNDHLKSREVAVTTWNQIIATLQGKQG